MYYRREWYYFFSLLGGDVNDPSPRSRRLEISFNQYAENKVLNIQITLLQISNFHNVNLVIREFLEAVPT